MSTVSSLGLGSGIEAETIITQLMALEKQPITNTQSANSELSTKLSTWGKVQSGFSAVKDASAALTKSDFWSATTATSSDESAVAVTTSSTSSPGSYSVSVEALAQAQYLASAPQLLGKTAVIGEGTLRIEFGKIDSTPVPPTFTAISGVSAIDVNIGPGDNTMEKIRDKINSANTGVTATLVSDASGTRLVLRGSTGEDSAFRVTATDSDGSNNNATGLSALSYDPTAASSPMSRTQEAKNAKAQINGLEVTSKTNTLSDVVDGLTIKLGKKTTTAVDLTIKQDTDGIKKGIDTFVSAYNDIVGMLRVQTLYDADSKTAGPLQGDSTATGLLRQLRSMAASSTTASSTFTRLSDIGLSMAKDGSLSANATKLTTAMGNLSELKTFFANSDSTDSAKDGLAERFRKLAAQVTDVDGSIGTRTTGIKSTIKRNEDKIERLQDRNSLMETRLRKQYTALDQSMAKLSGLSSYVTAQLNAINKSSSS